jgi:hypothetical protein
MSVTIPASLTVAMALFDDDQVTATVVSACPLELTTVTDSATL